MYNRRQFLKRFLAAAAAPLIPAIHSTAAQAGSGLQYVVFDPENNTIILEKQGDVRRHPASLTKMMTALLVFEAISDTSTTFNLGTEIDIPETIDLVGEGIADFDTLRTMDTANVEKLLIGMGSRSDALSTLALVNRVGHPDVYDWEAGTDLERLHEFIDRMNIRAQELGMHNSHFSVVTGLPFDNHYSTPADMALLVHHLQEHFPKLTEITFGQARFDLEPISPASRHTSRLLRARPDRVSWAKTGMTDDAGYCLAVRYVKDGKPLIGIVMGANSRNHRNQVMLDKLTQAYEILSFPRPTEKPALPEN